MYTFALHPVLCEVTDTELEAFILGHKQMWAGEYVQITGTSALGRDQRSQLQLLALYSTFGLTGNKICSIRSPYADINIKLLCAACSAIGTLE